MAQDSVLSLFIFLHNSIPHSSNVSLIAVTLKDKYFGIEPDSLSDTNLKAGLPDRNKIILSY